MSAQTFNEILSDLLTEHTPNLSEKAEDEIDEVLFNGQAEGIDHGDLAIRYCSCGTRIDGFYEYIAHLRVVGRDYAGSLSGV